MITTRALSRLADAGDPDAHFRRGYRLAFAVLAFSPRSGFDLPTLGRCTAARPRTGPTKVKGSSRRQIRPEVEHL